MTKTQLCWQIVKNLAWLLSYDFWRAVFFEKEFQTRAWVSLILFAACADILRMVLVPGYPDKTAP